MISANHVKDIARSHLSDLDKLDADFPAYMPMSVQSMIAMGQRIHRAKQQQGKEGLAEFILVNAIEELNFVGKYLSPALSEMDAQALAPEDPLSQ